MTESRYKCECEFDGKRSQAKGHVGVCLYHRRLYELLDAARPAMAGDNKWMELADELPRATDFPLEKS